ncbi:hypothetical protein KC323_g90 [Hortaea werneckii]|nr:hypothetical protein KC323_g90 [Hortaea werneckii]KAI7360060.1 hypothetical protein KC320_g30 [Hortaea werneckii]
MSSLSATVSTFAFALPLSSLLASSPPPRSTSLRAFSDSLFCSRKTHSFRTPVSAAASLAVEERWLPQCLQRHWSPAAHSQATEHPVRRCRPRRCLTRQREGQLETVAADVGRSTEVCLEAVMIFAKSPASSCSSRGRPLSRPKPRSSAAVAFAEQAALSAELASSACAEASTILINACCSVCKWTTRRSIASLTMPSRASSTTAASTTPASSIAGKT